MTAHIVNLNTRGILVEDDSTGQRAIYRTTQAGAIWFVDVVTTHGTSRIPTETAEVWGIDAFLVNQKPARGTTTAMLRVAALWVALMIEGGMTA